MLIQNDPARRSQLHRRIKVVLRKIGAVGAVIGGVSAIAGPALYAWGYLTVAWNYAQDIASRFGWMFIAATGFCILITLILSITFFFYWKHARRLIAILRDENSGLLAKQQEIEIKLQNAENDLARYRECEESFSALALVNASHDRRFFDSLFGRVVRSVERLLKIQKGVFLAQTLSPVGEAIQRSIGETIEYLNGNIAEALTQLNAILTTYTEQDCATSLKIFEPEKMVIKTLSRDSKSSSLRRLRDQAASNTPFLFLRDEKKGLTVFMSDDLAAWRHPDGGAQKYEDDELNAISKKYNSIIVTPVYDELNSGNIIAFIQADCLGSGLANDQCHHYVREVGYRMSVLLYRRIGLQKTAEKWKDMFH